MMNASSASQRTAALTVSGSAPWAVLPSGITTAESTRISGVHTGTSHNAENRGETSAIGTNSSTI
jgi:hypothetical protein